MSIIAHLIAKQASRIPLLALKKKVHHGYNLTFSFIKFQTEEQYSVCKSGSLYIEN